MNVEDAARQIFDRIDPEIDRIVGLITLVAVPAAFGGLSSRGRT